MNKTNISLSFTAGFVADKTLDIEIYVDQQTVYQQTQIQDKKFTVNIAVTLPCSIKIAVSGKNMQTDTVLDTQGNILADKFIRLDEMVVDRMPIKPYLLQNSLIQFTTTAGQESRTNYFGFNGTAIIDMQTNDSLTYLLQALTLG